MKQSAPEDIQEAKDKINQAYSDFYSKLDYRQLLQVTYFEYLLRKLWKRIKR